MPTHTRCKHLYVHTRNAMRTHMEGDLLVVIIIAGQACTRVPVESVQVAHKHTHSREWRVCITKPLFVTGRP